MAFRALKTIPATHVAGHKQPDARQSDARLGGKPAHHALKDVAGAIADYDKAIELNPADATAYVARGEARRLLKDFDKAVADFTQVIGMDPKNAMAYSYRGLAKVNLKNYEEALADCSKATELDPQNAPAWENLGYVQNDLLQFQAALENFRKAFQLDPLLDDSRFRIWLLRARLGEPDAATRELAEHVKSLQGARAADWAAKIGQFLTGTITEEDFLSVAKTSARNPKAQSGQFCQANYYAGMKRLLAGDKEGAVALFKKCLGTGEKGYMEFSSATVELNALKK
jgi:lipoprotein NlpI